MKINSLIKKILRISTEFPLKILQYPLNSFLILRPLLRAQIANRWEIATLHRIHRPRKSFEISCELAPPFNCPLENMDEPWQITGIISTCVLVRVTSLETRGRCMNTIKDAYILLFGLFIFASSRLSLFASTPFFLSSFPPFSPQESTLNLVPFFFFLPFLLYTLE